MSDPFSVSAWSNLLQELSHTEAEKAVRVYQQQSISEQANASIIVALKDAEATRKRCKSLYAFVVRRGHISLPSRMSNISMAGTLP